MQPKLPPLLAVLLLTACGAPPQPGVDIVFVNARAWTLDADMPWAQALAVNGDAIA